MAFVCWSLVYRHCDGAGDEFLIFFWHLGHQGDFRFPPFLSQVERLHKDLLRQRDTQGPPSGRNQFAD
jgi:hypothetical protein